MDLKLKNQLCFPMYLVSKEIIKKYEVLLAPLSLTYTQYIVMVVLWEFKEIDMKALGKKLYLNSSTLTPVVNRLIEKNYLSKKKDEKDKRNLIIRLEKEGAQIQEEVKKVPQQIFDLVDLSEKEAKFLYEVLYKIVSKLSDAEI